VTAAAPDALAHHLHGFRTLTERARQREARGRWDAAAAWAQIAAHHAWMNHTGLFASPELEETLARLGSRLPDDSRSRRRPADPHEVLHVVTQCYGTGGSTQAIASWIQQDRGRHHRVCITRQRGKPPPEKISGTLTAPSDLIRLDTGTGGLMSRAARLRALARESDLVVLHLHPYDVVPQIALSAGSGLPPVVYVDHCDHVFWVGVGISSLVMHMRDSGRVHAAARRGLDPARSAVVARPLRPLGRQLTRAEAKRRLGIAPDTVVLATAADPTKYRPVGDTGFLDVVLPALDEHPDAILLAAGPSIQEPMWQAAARRTDGRVRPLGMLPDARLLQEAADVYLDSFPFSSLTSLLEAGSLGVPAITYRGHPPDCAVLGADTRGVDDHMIAASDPAEYRSALRDLILDSAGREELGRCTARAILDTHSGPGWLKAAHELYARAAEAGAPSRPVAVDAKTDRVDVLVDLVMNQTGFADGVPGAIREHLSFLPPRERAAAWIWLTRAGTRPPHGNLMPEWALARLWRYRQTSRRLTRAARATLSGAERGHA
jgi:hypothetical protein